MVLWFLRLTLKHKLNFFIRLLSIHIILNAFGLGRNKTLKTTTKKSHHYLIGKYLNGEFCGSNNKQYILCKIL